MRRSADHPSPRDRIWAEICKGQTFSLRSVSDKLKLDRKTTSDYLRALHRADYITLVRAADSAVDSVYGVSDRVGGPAPRLRADGSEVEQGRGTESMWRAMGMLPRFTLRELVAVCNTGTVSVSEKTAASYIGHLIRAGYIRILHNGRGRGKEPSVYELVDRTGPRAPMIQRVKRVYDPNTGRVHDIDQEDEA